MADVQVQSAELKDGTLTVTGSGFTRTTTVVEIDGNEMPFTLSDDGTITVTDVPAGAKEVDVTKGEVTQSAQIDSDPNGSQTPATGSAGDPGTTTAKDEPFNPGGDVHREGYKTETPNATPGDLVEDDLKTTGDASVEDINQGAGSGAEQKNPASEPIRAEGAGDLNIDPREPYPTGNPPDPREEFRKIHGFYPPDDQGGPNG